MRRARKGPRALGRLRKSLNATKRSLWKALLDAARAKRGRLRKSLNGTKRCLWKPLLDAARARRSQSSGAAPEEPITPLNTVSGRLCWMRCARKGPRALGRLRNSLNATKRSLWKALLDAARARRSQSSGAAPEESKRH